MSFNEKDLESALFRLGHLSKRELILVVWADTGNDCRPIAKLVGITLPKDIKDKTARDIIRGINSKTWILAIIDDHKNVYKIVSANEFAEKSCKTKEDKVLVLKKKLTNEEVIHITKPPKQKTKGEKIGRAKRKTSSS